MTNTKHNLYITRHLTKPWEGEHRKLHYFDFEKSHLKERSSKFVVAEKKLWPQSYEDLFNKSFEDDFAKQKAMIILGTKDGRMKVRWRDYRSIVLMFAIHTLRMARAYFSDKKALDMLKGKGSRDLDGLVSIWGKKFDIVRIPLPTSQILCFPDSFYYPFPMKKNGRIGVALGVSIHPRVIVASVEKGSLNEAWVKWLIKMRQFMNYSVGTNKCNRVVVHEDLIQSAPNKKVLEMHLKAARAANQRVVANMNILRAAWA